LEAANLAVPSWLDVVKKKDGGLTYDIRPRPKRDVRKRNSVATQARKSFRSKQNNVFAIDELITDAELERLLTNLETNSAQLKSAEIEALQGLKVGLEEIEDAKLTARAKAVADAIGDLLQFEASHDPFQHGINILADRVPPIINFSAELRELQIPYNLSLFNNPDPNSNRDPSQSLSEILRLADLELDVLISSINEGNGAAVEGLMLSANTKLAEQSAGLWKQSDATLHLKLDGYSLDVLVKNTENFEIKDQFSNFSQRSDGYKQFVALQIFTFLKKVDGAILLIDEIEQHLHYDAQASLIQILQNEPSIGSVVYTTHSAGALPEDLGVGVRMVHWDESRKKVSKIINKFWHADPGGGFKPLLFGMGAASLAFLPTRRALIGEGATEMLLLPRMLREALGPETLDFQVIHGLSHINPKGLPMADNLSNGVCFMVDNDEAGVGMAKDLSEAGVPKSHIFSVADVSKGAVTVEDLIHPTIWLRAVNQYIEQFGRDRQVEATLENAPEFGRIVALPAAIRKEKVAFAYNVLDFLQEDPQLKILAPKHAKGAKVVAEKIRVSLGLA
jgi:AAA domain, putative AbiEii toxin, Type IV TA system